MYKIGLVGNSCTGKSTAAFSIIKLLKMKRCLTAYVTDACRFVTFPPAKFDTQPVARLNVLFQQLANECEQMVRDDADYLVMERTVMDWWLYYKWTAKRGGREPFEAEAIEALVKDWAAGFDLLLFMTGDGMVYVNDGFRPASTQMRDELESEYNKLFDADWLGATAMRTVARIGGDSLESRNAAVEHVVETWLADDHLRVRPSRIPHVREER